MVIATLFFLGLALCVFAGLMCLALAKSVETARAQRPPAEEKLAWEQIKTAMAELYSRYETMETPRQKTLRSWAGTLIVCAGLCLIGLVIGIDYNNSEATSFGSNLSCILGAQRVASEQMGRHEESEQATKAKEKAAAESKK